MASRTSIEFGVHIDKGEEVSKNYWSRYVGKKISRGPQGSLVAEFFAATPPLGCLKFLLVWACADKFPDENSMLRKSSRTQCVLFIDVNRAQFTSPARKRTALELPQEFRKPEADESGVLKKGDVRHERRHH